MRSIEIYNRLSELKTAVNAAIDANDMDEAHRLEGEIRATDAMLAQALAEEDEARNAQIQHQIETTTESLASELFGPRDAFDGIREGFRRNVSVRNAVSGLSTPQIYKYDLEGPIDVPRSFLGTLPHGTTDGDEHFFQIPTFANNAATWTEGNKAESAIAWTPDVAHIETIAHQMPIQKQTARRYSQLEGIVRNVLMLGLDQVCCQKSLRSNNSTGIIGVCNYTGIISHTKNANKNLKDTFQTMARKVRMASGSAAGYVALSPYAIEVLSQTKDEIGHYLFENVHAGGTIAGLTIVEDVNMTTGTGSSAKETAMVYYAGGASWNIADPEEVTIGLVGNQFIQNAYTLLAELTAALKVTQPAAFAYCDDLGIAPEA